MYLPEQDLQHVVSKAKNALLSLQGGRIFLTGGTGFFGIWLLESLAFARQYLGLTVTVTVLTRQPEVFLSRFPEYKKKSWLVFHQGDIKTFAYPEGEFTHVIHAATEASAQLNKDKPLYMLDTITQGSRRALDFALHAKVKRFLLVSSGAMYGRQPSDLTHIPEVYQGCVHPLMSAYGIGKLYAEHVSQLYFQHHQLPVTIARCFAFVGPGLPLTTHFAIGNFINNILQGDNIFIAGDGSPYRSYLYAADLAICLWTILAFGGLGEAYNVGSDHAISILALAQTVAKQANREISITVAKKPLPNQLAERYVPSILKMKQILNLEPWVLLDDAISRTLQWHQEQIS